MVPALVAAAARPERCTAGASLLWCWRHGYCTLVVSDELLSEYEDVLQRAPFSVTLQSAKALRSQFTRLAHVVSPAVGRPLLTVDPGDDMVLKAAIAGKADLLVTNNRRDFEEVATLDGGTADLKYRGVHVVNLTDALRAIYAQHPSAKVRRVKHRKT